MERELLATVQNTVRVHRMLKGVKRVLIGFSAGPDSVALLDILHRLYSKTVKLYLGYVNHQLRRSALREEEMTKQYARRYRIGYRILRIDLKEVPMKEGLESTARELRYKNLECMAAGIGAQKIALAHNADDLIETFIINIMRGGGALGLSGMPPTRGKVIRPLMEVPKAELLSYLRRRKLTYALDRTNLSMRFRRNYVRKEIVPRLARVNPAIYRTMLRSLGILRSEETYLGRQADETYHRVTEPAGKGISLDIRELLKYDIALVRRVIRRAVHEVRGDLHGIEYQHIDQIVDLGNKKTGKVVFLPGGLVVEREYGQLRLHPVETEGCSFDIALPLNRELVLSESGIKVKASVVKSMRERHRIFQAPHHTAYFDLDRVHRPLRLRCRRQGDVFLMFDGHRKKVKDVFIDRKMTRRERQLIPLLVDRRSILWIVGVARSGWAKVTPATKRILVVKTENTY